MSAQTKPSLDWLAELLAEETGMDPEVLGAAYLYAALQTRLAASNTADAEQYRRRIQTDPRERELLLSELTVPETWFFRDLSAFQTLAREAEGLPGQIRILCAPCSSGEEPYSAAIMLLQAGRQNFSIDALDLNERALSKAREGVYDRHSFRGEGLQPELQKRYFQPATAHAEESPLLSVSDEVREHVSFRRENLHQPVAFAFLPEYDFVFCRNLLIYFRHDARNALLERLIRKLRPGGLLFTGHAEVTCAVGKGLRPLEERGLFALRKITPEGRA